MVQSMRAARTALWNRQRGPVLCAAVLAAAAALAGCADGSTQASLGQPASWRVAGLAVPAPTVRTPAQACYGSPGLVDDCGPFARYNGP